MTAARRPHPPWSFWSALALVAFVLNWVWEMLQIPASRETAGRSWAETLGPCTLAALGDVGLTFAVFGLGALAAAVEARSTASGWWSYMDRMPVVPVLGVGLWPLLQLALLIPASIRVA